MKMRIYAMVSVNDKNIDYFTERGIIKTDRLNVRSFKVYADGALGSRGAALIEPYTDRENHYGAMVTSLEDLKNIAKADFDRTVLVATTGDAVAACQKAIDSTREKDYPKVELLSWLDIS